MSERTLQIISPTAGEPEIFEDPVKAVERLQALYRTATDFLAERFSATVNNGGQPAMRYRAF